MSRNIRRKLPAKPPSKPRKRRDSDSSSSLDLSDDGGYSAIEDISDSEDDDEDDVNAVEEESILAEGNVKPVVAPRPPLDVEDEEDLEDEEEEKEGEDEDENEDGGGGDDDDDDEEEEEEDDDDEADEQEGQESIEIDEGDADDNASWGGIVSEADGSQASDFYAEANHLASDIAVERHVRFDVPDSDSDSTETEDDHADLFPDIFVSQTALDPAFRREIEHDPDESSGSGSFWDYHGQYEEDGDDSDSEAEEIIRRLSDDEAPMAVPGASEATNGIADFTPAFEETLELDGYETDGDTTDEEDVPEPIIRKRTRRPSNAISEMSDSEMDSPVKSQRGQPRVGRFRLDRSDKKPIAVLNPLTKKMMIFTPHRRRQLDLSPEQFSLPWSIEEQQTPLLGNPANMMLSAMFSTNTFGDFVNANTVGPAEAFFPFPSEANTADESPSSPSLPGDEDEDEGKLDISDFITWGEDVHHSSGDEATNDDWEQSAPRRPITAHGDMDVLSHLTSDTVGAFRRNQINQQLILSNQATQDSLAFSGPYNFTALRGLRSDRFDTAGVPLTPIRRHKRSTTDNTRSPVEVPSTKRKAPGETGGNRKRARSISEVNFLRL